MQRKKEKEKKLKDSIVPNILLREKGKCYSTYYLPLIYFNKVYISKLSFIIILFDKISKNPSLIIYADLKITTLDRRDGCLNS